MRLLLLFTLLGIFACFAPSAHAQRDNAPGEQVIIDYADGSLFIGTVVSAGHGLMQVELNTGDTVNLKLAMIDKMVNSGNHLINRRGKFHYRSGYFGMASVAFGSSDRDASGQFDIMLGYRLKERIALGLGLAADIHDLTIGNSWSTLNFTPVYGYGRYYLNDSNWRLFADSKLGYAFANVTEFSDGHSGGLYFQPGIGFHIATKGKFKPLLSLSSLMLNTRGTSTGWISWGSSQVNHNYNVWLNRIIFRIAVEFK